MSKELTKQWKKGQLKAFKWYYVKFKSGEVDICWFTEWSNDELGTGGQYFDGIKEENILEVLKPVPSYNILEQKQKSLKILAEEYYKEKEENQKLKKQLEIVKKYLTLIKRNVSIGSLAYTYVSNAQTDIKELEK